MATTLEWLLKVLRVCQAYFRLLAHLKNPCTNRGVLVEVQLLNLHAIRREYQSDTSFKTARKRAENWCFSCSDPSRALHLESSSKSSFIVRNFHRWCSTSLADIQQEGLTCDDCYLHTHGDAVEQRPKRPDNNCSLKLNLRHAWKPSDESLTRMTCLLGTTFAGGQGLSALLATAALATGRQEQPDTILIPVGPGKDWKTMVFVDLMSPSG